MVKPQPPQCQETLPYRNPAAMKSYYLAVVSLLPLLGLPLGMAAFFLGIAGLRTIRQLPEAKGSVHAWVGVIVGGGTTVVG